MSARKNAQDQWNSTACGQVSGIQDTLAYFRAVEEARYKEQPWMSTYFNFNQFADKKVLEIGVGQGTDLVQFGRVGAKVYGIDITENHLNLTKKNFELRDLSVELRESDATQLPFGDNFFDCVYSFGVLHHIPEIDQCISEINRVLKPGATFFMALYYKWSAFHLFSKILGQGIRHGDYFRLGYKGLLSTIESGADGKVIKPYVRTYSKREVVKLLKAFLLEDISIHQLHEDHFYPSFMGRLLSSHLTSLENKLGWYVVSKATKIE